MNAAWMKVMVQDLKGRRYLAKDRGWVSFEDGPTLFENAVTAITFCIRMKLREVRLVRAEAQDGESTYIYPFGYDPGVKKELKQLRRLVRKRCELRWAQRVLKRRLAALRVESKEAEIQFSFQQKPLGKETKCFAAAEGHASDISCP